MIKKRIYSFLIAFLLVLFLVNPTNAFAFEPRDNRSFMEPFYSYTYFNGGNCVWFAWEMAYQEWGLILPYAGNACNWIKLEDESVYQDEIKYRLKLSDDPIKNSIAIFQKDDLNTLAGRSFKNDHYGHVAWIYDIDDSNPHKIYVVESTIHPPSYGNYWHGCWWQKNTYNVKNLPSMKYLYVGEARFYNKEHRLTFKIYGINPFVEKVDNNTYKVSVKENDKIYIELSRDELVYIDCVEKVTLLKGKRIEADICSNEVCIQITDSLVKITPILPEGKNTLADITEVEEDGVLSGLLLSLNNKNKE